MTPDSTAMPLPIDDGYVGSSFRYPRVRPCGESALTVELGDGICDAVNNRVIALAEALAEDIIPIRDMIVSYRSLLIEYDVESWSFDQIAATVIEKCNKLELSARLGRHWEVPVVYGGQFGVDLDAYARARELSTREVVRLHISPRYRAYMIGFTPGFVYLGGLDPSLSAPRRADPRREVAAGAISVGGAQTGISGVAAPSGWHQIGRTPVRTYDPRKSPPCLFEPGDLVTFVPLLESEWHSLALAAYRGENVAREYS